jgi:hypothetical protein
MSSGLGIRAPGTILWVAMVLLAPQGESVLAKNEAGAAKSATPAEIHRALAQLKDKETRLAALQVLLPFASMRIYQVGGAVGLTGDPDRDALISKVASRLTAYHDFETVRAALHSSSKDLQFWGCTVVSGEVHPHNGFPRQIRRGVRPASVARWKTLLPRLREIAADLKNDIRGMAQEVLGDLEGEEEFLRSLADRETDLFNIQRLVYGPPKTLNERMQPHVLRLLNDADASVRCDAMTSIGFNSNVAPMWRMTFSKKVFEKVMELSRAENEEERASAVYALAELRNVDPDAVRKRMFEIAEDKHEVEGVRWQIAFVLRDQVDRPDVRALMVKLLHDPSAQVRDMSLLPLDPGTFRKEFERIAADDDARRAPFARRKLRELDGPPAKSGEGSH